MDKIRAIQNTPITCDPRSMASLSPKGLCRKNLMRGAVLRVSTNLNAIVLKVKMRKALLLVSPIDKPTKGPGRLEGEMTAEGAPIGATASEDGPAIERTAAEMTETPGGTADDLDPDLTREGREADPRHPDLTVTGEMIDTIEEVTAAIEEAGAPKTTIGRGGATEIGSTDDKPRRSIHISNRERRLLTRMTKRSSGMGSSG